MDRHSWLRSHVWSKIKIEPGRSHALPHKFVMRRPVVFPCAHWLKLSNNSLAYVCFCHAWWAPECRHWLCPCARPANWALQELQISSVQCSYRQSTTEYAVAHMRVRYHEFYPQRAPLLSSEYISIPICLLMIQLGGRVLVWSVLGSSNQWRTHVPVLYFHIVSGRPVCGIWVSPGMHGRNRGWNSRFDCCRHNPQFFRKCPECQFVTRGWVRRQVYMGEIQIAILFKFPIWKPYCDAH